MVGFLWLLVLLQLQQHTHAHTQIETYMATSLEPLRLEEADWPMASLILRRPAAARPACPSPPSGPGAQSGSMLKTAMSSIMCHWGSLSHGHHKNQWFTTLMCLRGV